MNKLTPFNVAAEFSYLCPYCDAEHCVSQSDATKPGFSIVCYGCGNALDIEAVASVDISVEYQSLNARPPCWWYVFSSTIHEIDNPVCFKYKSTPSMDIARHILRSMSALSKREVEALLAQTVYFSDLDVNSESAELVKETLRKYHEQFKTSNA